jgi:hypothetical protein
MGDNDIEYTLRVTADTSSGTQTFTRDMDTAAQSSERLSSTLKAQNAAMSETTRIIQQAAAAASAGVSSTNSLEAAIERLAGQLDKSVAAATTFNQRMDLLDQALAQGVITAGQHANMSQQVAAAADNAGNAAGRAAASVNALGMSANMTVHEFRAMADELASGRMTQFDGTLVNVISHIGMANPEIALMVLGFSALSAPLIYTIAAMENYMSGVDEMVAKTNLFGNVSDASVGQLVNLANGITDVGNVSLKTAESLTAIGQAAGLSLEQTQKLGQLSQTFSNALGLKDADAAMKQMTADLQNPVEGFKKLNDQLNLFTSQDRDAFQQATESNNVYQQRTIILNALIDRMNQYAAATANTPQSKFQSIESGISTFFTQAGAGAAGAAGMTDEQINKANELAEAQQHLKDIQDAGFDTMQGWGPVVADLKEHIAELTTEVNGSGDAMDSMGNKITVLTSQMQTAAITLATSLIPGFKQLQQATTQSNTLGSAIGAIDPKTGASPFSENEIDDLFLGKNVADRKQSYAQIDPAQRQIMNLQAQIAIRQQYKGNPAEMQRQLAMYNARQTGLAAGYDDSEVNQIADLTGQNAEIRHTPKGRQQRDLTKGFNQQNQDQLNLASAYSTGDPVQIASQQAQNEALEKTTYNTTTSVSALTEAILKQKAALADAQGAAAVYAENLKLVAQQTETAGYEQGGVAGLNAAKNREAADQQFNGKIAAAQASGDQGLTQQIQQQKQQYYNTLQQIDASKQQLQIDQQSASNTETIKELQTQLAGVQSGTLKPAQDQINESVKIYWQLQQQGLTVGSDAFQNAYQKLMEQQNAIATLNKQLEEAKTAQANYKEEFDEIGNAIGNAFEQGVLSGDSFRQTMANLLTDIAKIIFQMEVLKPLMASLDASSAVAGSGGLFGSLLGKLGSLFGASAGEAVADPIAAGTGVTVAGVIAHSGSIAGGNSPNGTRSMDPSTWSGASRYHTGGIVDGEVPIIAQQGEAVMPTVRMANGQLGVQMTGSNSGGGGVQVQVPVTMSIQYQGSGGSGSGSTNDMNDFSNKVAAQLQAAVDQRISSWAADAVRPGGALSGTQSSRFGGG